MQVTVHNNGPTTTFHTATKPNVVEIEVTAQEVKAQQARSFVQAADTICRIKMVDEDGDYAWFAITPVVKNGRPGVEVEYIGTVDETAKKRLTGKWKSAQVSEL